MTFMKVQLFTDGGARGNPGPAAIGVVIKDLSGNTLEEYNEYIGTTTNNQAEYLALKKGISLAKKRGAQELDCFLDSELVVKQMNREYKVKDAKLALLFVEIWNMIASFRTVHFFHIERSKNKQADGLVNHSLDITLHIK